MSNCKKITVKESEKELRRMINKSSGLIAKRLLIILVCKQHEDVGISRRELGRLCNCGHCMAHRWRCVYEKKGITALLTHNRTNHVTTILDENDKARIREKLQDVQNPLKGYVELQQWIEDNLGKKIKYNTIYNFVRHNYHTKIKAVRRSHVRKDAEAANTFKKTSVLSVGQ